VFITCSGLVINYCSFRDSVSIATSVAALLLHHLSIMHDVTFVLNIAFSCCILLNKLMVETRRTCGDTLYAGDYYRLSLSTLDKATLIF